MAYPHISGMTIAHDSIRKHTDSVRKHTDSQLGSRSTIRVMRLWIRCASWLLSRSRCIDNEMITTIGQAWILIKFMRGYSSVALTRRGGRPKEMYISALYTVERRIPCLQRTAVNPSRHFVPLRYYQLHIMYDTHGYYVEKVIKYIFELKWRICVNPEELTRESGVFMIVITLTRIEERKLRDTGGN